MKAKEQSTITIQQIIQTIESNPLGIETSREILYKSVGTKLSFSGIVEKKITRHKHLKLFVRPDLPDEKTLMIFAEFTEKTEAERLIPAKIRKGSKLRMSGIFQTCGYSQILRTLLDMINDTSFARTLSSIFTSDAII